jgi:hypothetical protein
MPGSSRGSFYARVIATNRRTQAVLIPRYASPFRHGRAASLALKRSPFMTWIFGLDAREPHWRAASRAQGMDDFVPIGSFMRLMSV